MNLRILLISFGFSLCALGQSAETPTLNVDSTYTLAQCIAIALENNLDIRIQKEHQQIADNNASYAHAGGLPTVTIGAGVDGRNVSDYSTSTAGVYSETPARNTYLGNAGLNVSWTIFEGLKVFSTLDRLQELKQMGDLSLRMRVEDVIANVARSYFTIVRENIRKDNLKATLELSDERLKIVRQQFHLGEASRLDLLQAEVDYNNDNYAFVKQQEAIHTYRLNLNTLLALREIDFDLQIAHDSITLAELGTQADMLDKVMVMNAEILAAASDVKVKEQDLKIINARFFPTLKFKGGYGYDGTWYDVPPTDNSQRLTLNYGLTLSMNLFDRGNAIRSKRNAQHALNAMHLEREKMLQKIESEVLNLWMAYENNKQLIALEKVNQESARSLYQSSLDRYRLGELSGIELRTAQNNLLKAEERFSQAQYDAKMIEMSLLLLSGEIVNLSRG